MGTFDLTSPLEPTDEQLQALMDAVGETGRRSMSNAKAILQQMLMETFDNREPHD